MNLLSTSEEKKSRLRIVFETFALLGAIMTWFTGSVVPIFAAGVLFCICALNWRTDVQRQKYRTAWIAIVLVGFVAGTAVAIYLKK
jgi:hypothetical protein